MSVVSIKHYDGGMKRFRTNLLGFSALLGVLGGCATPPTAGGGLKSFQAPSATAPVAPGPGWVLLGTHRDGAVFMHPHSTLRLGSSAFIMLVAAKREPAVLPGGVTVGSLKERIEIDCEKRRFRRHDGTVHPDQGALGPVLGRVGQDQWREISPNTVMAALSLVVCSASTPPDTAPPPGTPDIPPGPASPRFQNNRGGTFTT